MDPSARPYQFNSHLTTDMGVESILNRSSSEQPPRTSTPTKQTSELSNDSSMERNNFTIKQQTYARYGNMITRDGYSDNNDDDLANISKDTDDFVNNSALDTSGGLLVGVNESTDRSKESSGASEERLPYTVQIFDDTNNNMSSISPPNGRKSNLNDTKHSQCEERIKELEKLSTSLSSLVDDLKNQVTTLVSRVQDLECKAQHREGDSNYTGYSNQSLQEASKIRSDYDLSKSIQSMNKTVPLLDTNLHSTSTYNRADVASMVKNLNSTVATPYVSTNMRSPIQQSIASTRFQGNGAKTFKRSNIHASTNSVHVDSLRQANLTLSPNTNLQPTRQQISPRSYGTLYNKREPSAFTSMLSLCSNGPSSTFSTLKKGSAVSGSALNLSQNNSQLSAWPSISNFIESKHRAKEVKCDLNERLIYMTLYGILVHIRIPNWVEFDYSPERVIEPPSVRLKLNWVNGYRGRDCRSNLYYLPTGECVYFVASIVVLHNPSSKTQRHYLGHTDNIKCLAIHPNKLIVASGQSASPQRKDKRPIVRVWNTVSLATLRVIGFNEDFDRSICCLAFSRHDQGATLVVVDESSEHIITLLDWQREKSWRIAEANSGHESVLAIDFHPIDKYSLVAVGRAGINFWDVRGMTLTKKAGFFDKYDKPKYVLCMTFNDLGETITGDSNGNVIIWPRGSNRPRQIIHDVHQGGVFSVLAMKDGSYLTGGRDRRIVECDEDFNYTGRETEVPEQCGGIRFLTYARGSQVLIGTLRNCILLGSLDTGFTTIMQGHSEATSALAIHPIKSHYLTGGFDDHLHLFDAKTHETVWSQIIETPAAAASFSPNGHLLVVGSTIGKWLAIDAVTRETLHTCTDGSGTICCVKFSPDGEYFCLGSSDMRIYIYRSLDNGTNFARLGSCVGHSAPVHEIDWSDDSRVIQSQSMNLELLHWTIEDCQPLEDSSSIADLKWFTHNCTVGFDAMGLWSDSTDSTLINYCDKSNEEDLMVSASDTGNINIFRWPTCYNQCFSQKYYGNVDKFNFIKFLPDDSKLIAVGSKSCVTTEWIVEKSKQSV